MIIRSQNKSGIVLTENVTDFYEEETRENKYEVIAFCCNKTETVLGEYTTKEKALKVLDGIQYAYCSMKQNECSMGEAVKMMSTQKQEEFEEFIEMCRGVFIYQMPKDEEVNV